MKKSRFTPNLIFVAGIIAVVVLAYYARQKNSDSMSFDIDGDAPITQSNATNAETRGIDNASEPPPAEVADKEIEPLKRWVKEESVSLNDTGVDLQARDEYIADKVRSFGSRQLVHLQKIAQDTSATMNERILSAYMLEKSSGSRQNLIDTASAPSPEYKCAPHSECDIKYNQDRTIKIMSIDAIVKSTESVESRLAALQEIITKSNDDLVKKYATSAAQKITQ